MCLSALALFTCLGTVASSAQQPREGSNWQRVMALPASTKVDIRLTSNGHVKHVHCRVGSVTADSLACSGASITVPRTDILSIKIPRRGRSALIAGGVGALGLGIAGFVSTTNSNDSFFGPNFLRGPATAVGAIGGGLIGGGIGALTDFSKSTIYRAP